MYEMTKREAFLDPIIGYIHDSLSEYEEQRRYAAEYEIFLKTIILYLKQNPDCNNIPSERIQSFMVRDMNLHESSLLNRVNFFLSMYDNNSEMTR